MSESATIWTNVAHQAPPSMGFSRQEYRSGLAFPSPGDLPDPGMEPRSPTLQADTLTSEPPGKLRSKHVYKSSCDDLASALTVTCITCYWWSDFEHALCCHSLGLESRFHDLLAM